MTLVITRATKQTARYTDAGGRERCSSCRFFLPQGTCGRIIGPVSPRGWCRFYSQEAVQRWQPQGAQGQGGSPSLDLSFTSGSGTLDPRITFTRASTATYFDSGGVMRTAATNTPRWDYDPVTHALNGLLIEEARSNLLLNSATLGTQSVAVTAQAYTLSFYGTGTITKSGTAAGALVGTGVFPQRVSQTFTPTAGTLTLTVTGSVLSAQLEAGAFPTSYIPTTAAAVVRWADDVAMPSAGWASLTASTLVAEAIFVTSASASGHQVMVCLDDGSATNRAQIYRVASTNNVQNLLYGSGALNYAPTMSALTLGAVAKAAIAWRNGQQLSALNGVTAGADVQTAVPVALTALGLGVTTGTGTYLNGYLQRVRYWPRVLSSAEMQQVTT